MTASSQDKTWDAVRQHKVELQRRTFAAPPPDGTPNRAGDAPAEDGGGSSALPRPSSFIMPGTAGSSDHGSDCVPASSSRLFISPAHAPAQWQCIAEGFSQLLTPNFVDVIFKVRGKTSGFQYLAAHRTFIAAAWTILRDDLAKCDQVPNVEARKSALAWTLTLTTTQETESFAPTSTAGIVDVSGKQFGSYSIFRALLSQLYGKPVVISDLELGVLRAAAMTLGSNELAKCCDDVEVRPTRYAWNGPGASRSSTPELPVPVGQERGRALITNLDQGSKFGQGYKDFAKKPEPAEKPPEKGAYSGEARALPMAERSKQRGEHSFSADGTSASGSSKKQQSSKDKRSVHSILSEIKRNIVESSRIIADKTFQQTYDMVPGERGILGEGINGPVRMAKERKTGREVAVKRISCVNLSEQRRQMLVSEVRIFLQVGHRNIVQLYEVYESEVDQAVLLVMELCTGKELFERLAERKWYSEYDAARVTREMLDAVSYLHSQNICHRDLKLENWLYENPSQEARLKLCDFGFGQIVEPSVQLTATLGSLFYVAPEVLEGSYGLPCDMWSLGVIVYMLLSGVPPFDGKTDGDVMSKIRRGAFVSTGKRWEGISDSAKHFVRSMLRKDPCERLTAQEVVQHAWLKMDYQGNYPSKLKVDVDPSASELPIDREVVRDMWKFAQSNAVTRAALGLLAKIHQTTSWTGREQDVLLLEQRFKCLDEQNTGKIDAESFIKVLKDTLHLQISSAEEKLFFERIAGNIPSSTDDGACVTEHKARRRRAINYADFISMTKARRMANNTAAIRKAFREFDTLGDGYVKQDDMHKFLGPEFKSSIDQYMDTCGKDIIDYLHFATVISSEMAKKEGSAEAEATEVQQENVEIGNGRVCERILGPAGRQASESDLAAFRTRSDPDSLISSPDATGQGDAAVKGAEATGRDGPPVGSTDQSADLQSDEECDAEAQSDEEQLVNVVTQSATDGDLLSSDGQSGKEDQSLAPGEKPKEKLKHVGEKLKDKKEKKEARFQSFSLSLAGSSEYDDVPAAVNRVISMPSDKYSIKQLPGFHTRTLKPFYNSRPVSNIVLGLIRGTSLYAKQSVAAKLATIVHTACGWFFIMPNPKYHTEVDSRKGLLSRETGKFRFVAWWIHPRFVPQLRQWFERMTKYELKDRKESDRSESHRRQNLRASVAESGREDVAAAGESPGPQDFPKHQVPDMAELNREQTQNNSKNAEDMGSPGDFRFSDVPKPEHYLHSYRDLSTPEHVNMLGQLWEGTNRFLRSLFDESFMAHATVSAGFHYPVRTQYATLHMQVRVNAGNICGEDGRGMEINELIESFKIDRRVYERDSQPLRYHVTENVKVSLLAAANEYEEQNAGEIICRQISPLHYDLGATTMPTIQDEGEEEYEEEAKVKKPKESSEIQEVCVADSPEICPKLPQACADPDRDFSIAANHEVADEIPASYIINIQPTGDTKFSDMLQEMRANTAKLWGADPTHLYPLHVSVTGFFEASDVQVNRLKEKIPNMLMRELSSAGDISVGDVICTKTGYVLFDMQAAAITQFSQRLGEMGFRMGLNIRPKAVNHISLACNRPDEQVRTTIRNMFLPQEDPERRARAEQIIRDATFDLVLSRLIDRSSFERFAEDGPHEFAEVLRIPLAQLRRSKGTEDGEVHLVTKPSHYSDGSVED